MGKVVYFTGAPASGKSTTCRLLAEEIQHLAIWEYGARLTEFIQNRDRGVRDQTELRSISAGVVTAHDIETLDSDLIEFVRAERMESHVIIDSHAVTKEEFGYRVIPFSFPRFAQLSPDEIWMLFTDPAVAVDRIANDPAGRPSVIEEQARMHTLLQASVAETYAISLGIPLYLFDSSVSQSELVSNLVGRLQ